jgi:hypothetical protein
LTECKVLVDLSDSTYMIDGGEIEAFVAAMPLDHWPQSNKVAFVSTREIFGFHRLFIMRTELVARGWQCVSFAMKKLRSIGPPA